MTKPSLNANLIKKYHQDIVYNYAEYPTCDHLDYNYGSSEYKNALSDWMNNNQNELLIKMNPINFLSMRK